MFNEISVVVQGGIAKDLTKVCLDSIRKNLPGSEIILSTWEGACTEGLEPDKLILSKDPGGMYDPIENRWDNTNRQIVSTISGLKAISSGKKYALKVRSDSEIVSTGFCKDHLVEYPRRDEHYSLFKQRIVTCTLFTKKTLDNHSKIPVPFHISDWTHFGLVEDLINLWDIPLISDPSHYLMYNKGISHIFNGIWLYSRFAPEQYLLIEAIKKKFPNLEYNSIADFNSSLIKFSEKIIVNNFILRSPTNYGYYVNKKPYRDQINNYDDFIDDSYISESEFERLYVEQFGERS